MQRTQPLNNRRSSFEALSDIFDLSQISGSNFMNMYSLENLSANSVKITYIFRNKNLIFGTETEKSNFENGGTPVYIF